MTTVLMTADTVGGVWRYALELADALAPHVDVVLATMGRPIDDAQRAELATSAVAEVHESGFALEWMDEPWADVDRAAGWLLDLEDEVDPDLVHINGYAHAALPWRAPVLVVAHSCVVSWWEAVRRCPPPPSWEEYRRRVQAGLGNAAQVVAPTAAMLAALDRAYGVRGGTVVPNGRRCDAVGPGAKQRFVLSAGRLWDEAKNVAALDRIAPSVDGRVVIAGDATSPDGRTWAGGGADLLGSLPFGELAGWMQDAAVFALPARYEPFGLAALEAGLAGCALVLGDIPSLREVWADSALFVDPEDDLELQRAIQHLLDHPRPRRRMAAAARERASGYSLDRMARGYRSVYASLQPLATGVVAS